MDETIVATESVNWGYIIGPVLPGLLMLWPACRIFRRAGFAPYWGLAVLVPWFGLLLALMLLAHRPWPAAPPKPPTPARRGKRDIRATVQSVIKGG